MSDTIYCVYKTTNTINGKIYIGKHQTNNIDDGYLGSGILLTRAIRKYGKQNFSKEILKFFECDEDMNAYEAEIVNEEFVNRNNTYNLCVGGQGGAGPSSCVSRESRLRGIVKTAKKLKGRTKETHEYLKTIGEKIKGRTKENHEGIRKGIEVRKQTMENKCQQDPEYKNKIYEQAAQKTRGRTKENHEGRKRQAEKISELLKNGLAEEIAQKTRGRTKENHEGRRRQAEKISEILSGRTKETHEYLKTIGEKISGDKNGMAGKFGDNSPVSKYTNEQRLKVIELFEQGIKAVDIEKITNVKLSTVAKLIQHREKVKQNLIKPIKEVINDRQNIIN
jgi:hypothetical protein